MQSTLNPKQADPHDVLVVAPDVVLVAHADKEAANLSHDATRCPWDPQIHMGSDFSAGPSVPPVDTTFRPAAVDHVRVPGHGPSIGVRAVRAFIGFLLAVCIGVAGVVWQAYGDAAKQTIAKWTPQLVATSSPPENPGLPEQPNPPAVQANTATATPPQPAPLAQAAPEGVAAAAAAPESAVLLESMARELASARQEIDQLKASQGQMSRDIAKSSSAKSSSTKSSSSAKPSSAKSSQAKSSQTRAYEARAYDARASQTKPSEQNLRPRISALSPGSVAAPARRPMPSYPPPQAAAAPALPQAPAPYVSRQPEAPPQATAQPQAEPELSPVPRPPMPVLR
jgi:hypothetical protein